MERQTAVLCGIISPLRRTEIATPTVPSNVSSFRAYKTSFDAQVSK